MMMMFTVERNAPGVMGTFHDNVTVHIEKDPTPIKGFDCYEFGIKYIHIPKDYYWSLEKIWEKIPRTTKIGALAKRIGGKVHDTRNNKGLYVPGKIEGL